MSHPERSEKEFSVRHKVLHNTVCLPVGKERAGGRREGGVGTITHVPALQRNPTSLFTYKRTLKEVAIPKAGAMK